MRRGEEHLGMAQPTDAQCHLNEHTHLNSYIEPSSLSLSLSLSAGPVQSNLVWFGLVVSLGTVVTKWSPLLLPW